MAIIAIKAWYLDKYEPIREVVERRHDLRLNRNSLLKSGLRADFLDDNLEIQQSPWFQRYLEGDTVEFYIEGSGGYAISNIDLISHEIYFTKRDINSWLDPTVYLSYQTRVADASDALRTVLLETLESLNRRSRLPLTLEEISRAGNGPTRLSDSQLRKIQKCLLFVADGTAVARVETETFLDPLVCVELGYAIACKRSGQVLLVARDRSEKKGGLPFDLPKHQQLDFADLAGLRLVLPPLLETLLQKFNLISGKS